MISNILSKVLAGSVVGYITNYLAIQMLFKEYLKVHYAPWNLRFGLGGVIVKERKEFETRISQLVESDVIHHQAIEQELRKEEFEKVLHALMDTLFTEELPEVFPIDFTMAQIPGLEATKDQLIKELGTSLNEEIPHILPRLLQKLSPEAFISPQIRDNLSEMLLSLARETLAHSESIPPLLENVMEALAGYKFQDILDKNLSDPLRDNVQHLFRDFHQYLKYNHEAQIDNLISLTYQNLEVPKLLEVLSAQVAQKPLHQVLSQKNAAEVPQAIIGQIRKLFDSDVSNDIIRTLLKFVLKVLQEEKATVFELLSDDLKENFERFLEDKLPEIVAKLVPWIRQKKIKLELLIEESFRENTSQLGQLLVSVFVGNIGSYVGLEEKIIELIEKQDVQALARQASSYLLDYLRKNTISDIILRLNPDKILDVLVPILQKQVRESISQLKSSQLEGLLDKPLGNWFPKERIQNGLENLIQQLINNSFKDKWLYSPKSENLIIEHIGRQWKNLEQKEFGDWLAPEKRAGYVQSLMDTFKSELEKEDSSLHKNLSKAIADYIKNKKLDSFYQPKPADIVDSISPSLLKFINQEIDKLLDENPRDYIKRLQSIEQLNTRLVEALQNYLFNNLPKLMEGRVEALVKDNLAKQPDTKLRDMVHKAMGEELRPLSFFGAILGTITGALLLTMPEISNVQYLIAVSAIAYGITGWGTNWLAIRMLFKPYHPVKIPGTKWNVPFTPGVVAKYKARFAKSMGRFIGDRLLNQGNLKENFAKNQEALETGFKALFSKNDYAYIGKLIADNRDKLSQQGSQAFLDLAQNHQDSLLAQVQHWQEKNADKTFQELGLKEKPAFLQSFLRSDKIIPQLEAVLEKQLEKLQEKDAVIKDILPLQWSKSLFQLIHDLVIQELLKYEKNIEDKDLLDVLNLDLLERKISEFLAKNLEEILSPSQEEKLKFQIFDFLKNRIQEEALRNRIYKFIDDRLQEEFAPGKPIKDFFGGRFVNLIENNLNQIFQRILQMALEWLKENKDDIADRIYKEAYAQNSLAWTYKSSIRGTTKDLIEQGIPAFLEKEADSLQRVIHQEVMELGETQFNTASFIAIDASALKGKLEQMLRNEKLLKKVKQLSDIILEERIFKMPLNQLINDDSHQLLLHFKKILQPEITLIQNHLREKANTPEELEKISRPVSDLLIQILKRNVLSVRLSTFLKGISPADTQILSKKITGILAKVEGLDDQLYQVGDELWEVLKSQKLSQLSGHIDLKKEWKEALAELFSDEELISLIASSLEKITASLLEDAEHKFSPETKDYLIQKAVRAIFGTLDKNILPLINSINFKEIVVREISSMHAKELEGLFYGFASKYFKYLIGYGFIFGILFGLAIDFGILSLLGLL